MTVIGAGMGGLNAALQLKRAGIPFTVIEKNAGVGGTWYENRYPGARVDTPSRAYTHIFGVDFRYPNPFCAWTENQKYFDWVADKFDLREDIVVRDRGALADLGRGRGEWEIEVEGPGRPSARALERGDHRGRLPQPPEHPRDRGHATTSAARPGTRRAGPRTSTSTASGSR